MSEKINETKPAEETVLKADYDALLKEYNRIAAAYNKTLVLLGNTYVEKLNENILKEVDREVSK